MPVVGAKRAAVRPSVEPDAPEGRLLPQLGAAFRLEHSVASAVAGLETRDFAEEEGFDPGKFLPPSQAHLLRFIEDAESSEEAEAILDRLEEEQAAKRALEGGPLHPMLASLPAVAADPVNYLSLGAVAAYRAGRAADYARRATAAGFVSALAAESVLTRTQLTREQADAAANVAASTILSAGLSAPLGLALRRRRNRRLAEERLRNEREREARRAKGMEDHARFADIRRTERARADEAARLRTAREGLAQTIGAGANRLAQTLEAGRKAAEALEASRVRAEERVRTQAEERAALERIAANQREERALRLADRALKGEDIRWEPVKPEIVGRAMELTRERVRAFVFEAVEADTDARVTRAVEARGPSRRRRMLEAYDRLATEYLRRTRDRREVELNRAYLEELSERLRAHDPHPLVRVVGDELELERLARVQDAHSRIRALQEIRRRSADAGSRLRRAEAEAGRALREAQEARARLESALEEHRRFTELRQAQEAERAAAREAAAASEAERASAAEARRAEQARRQAIVNAVDLRRRQAEAASLEAELRRRQAEAAAAEEARPKGSDDTEADIAAIRAELLEPDLPGRLREHMEKALGRALERAAKEAARREEIRLADAQRAERAEQAEKARPKGSPETEKEIQRLRAESQKTVKALRNLDTATLDRYEDLGQEMDDLAGQIRDEKRDLKDGGGSTDALEKLEQEREAIKRERASIRRAASDVRKAENELRKRLEEYKEKIQEALAKAADEAARGDTRPEWETAIREFEDSPSGKRIQKAVLDIHRADGQVGQAEAEFLEKHADSPRSREEFKTAKVIAEEERAYGFGTAARRAGIRLENYHKNLQGEEERLLPKAKVWRGLIFKAARRVLDAGGAEKFYEQLNSSLLDGKPLRITEAEFWSLVNFRARRPYADERDNNIGQARYDDMSRFLRDPHNRRTLDKRVFDLDRLAKALEAREKNPKSILEPHELPSRVAAVMEADRILGSLSKISIWKKGGGLSNFERGLETEGVLSTLLHEAGHQLMFRRLTEGEREHLLKAAETNGWMKLYDVERRWESYKRGFKKYYMFKPGDYREALDRAWREEAVVEAFSYWMTNPSRIRVDAGSRDIFQRMFDYFKQVFAHIAKGLMPIRDIAPTSDYVSPRMDPETEDIFERILTGEVGQRPDARMFWEKETPGQEPPPAKAFPAEPPSPGAAKPDIEKEVDEALEHAEENFILTLNPEDTTLWAGRFGGAGKAAEALASLARVGLAAVSLRLITSPFAASREIFLRLGEPGGLKTSGNARGLPMGEADLDTAIKADRAAWLTRFLEVQNKEWKAYRKREREAGRKPMSPADFREQAGRSARRGGRHSIPEISRTANAAREIFEHWRQEANRRGLVIEGEVKTAETYAPRLWSRRKVEEGYAELLDLVMTRFKEAGDDSPEAKLRTKAAGVIEGFLRHGARSRAQPAYKVEERGALAERTFIIPDELVEDYLDNNIDNMVIGYLRTMVSDVHMQRVFKTVNPGDEVIPKLVYEEANLAKLANPERQGRVERRAREDVRLLRWYVDELRGLNMHDPDGAYAGLIRVSEAVRQYNFTRLLGAISISSLPDYGRHIAQAGFSRTLGVAMREFASGMSGLKIGIEEARRMGTANDMVLATRARQIMGLDETNAGRTKAERANIWLAQRAGVVTGISPHNTAMKAHASLEVTDAMLRMGEKLAAGGALTPDETVRLATLRITPAQLEAVWSTQREHFQDLGGNLAANIDAWTDPELKAAFRHAVVRETDNTIITPSAADTPAWASTEAGKAVFHLKRFLFAATTRILLAGLQNADARTVAAWSTMIGLGAFGVALRDLATKGEVQDRTTREWIGNAIDRSGVLGALVEADALAGRTTGLSMQRLLAGEAERFAGRSLVSQLLGPGAGLVEDAATAARQLTDAYATRADLAALRRLAPFQTLPGLSAALRAFEDGLGEDLPRNRREAELEEPGWPG